MAVNAEQNQDLNQQQNANQGQSNSTNAGQAPVAGSGTAAGGGGTSSTNSSGGLGTTVSNYSDGNQAGATGSGGRFTNLSKYIDANQGAGDRLASGIGQNLNNADQGAKSTANNDTQAVRDGIQAGQNEYNTGTGYLNQVGGTLPSSTTTSTGASTAATGSNAAPALTADQIAQNSANIAGNANTLQDFTNLRTGNAINTAGLNTLNTTAQTDNQALQSQLQGQLGQTSTDTGRYQLLKQAFGGGTVYQNPYSTGQQQLDNLFLQNSGNNGIANIQTGLRTDLGNAGNQYGELTGNTGTISQLSNNAKDLATGLQTVTAANDQNLINTILGAKDAVNGGYINTNAAQDAAKASIANAQTEYSNLQNGKAIDQSFADMLGLAGGQSLYDSTLGHDSSDYLKYGPTSGFTANSIATDPQRTNYANLAALAGDTSNQITANGAVAPAVSNGGSAGTLLNAISAAKNKFDNGTYNGLSGKNIDSATGSYDSNTLNGLINTGGYTNNITGDGHGGFTGGATNYGTLLNSVEGASGQQADNGNALALYGPGGALDQTTPTIQTQNTINANTLAALQQLSGNGMFNTAHIASGLNADAINSANNPNRTPGTATAVMR